MTSTTSTEPTAPAAATARGSRRRLPGWVVTAVVMVVLSIAAAVTLEVVFPAIQGDSARATTGVVAKGLAQGSLYALTAMALILVYRISRIINFAQVAIGSAAGYFLTQMSVGYELHAEYMIPVALVVAAIAGILAELAVRRFSRSPRLLVTIATITMAPAATLVMGRIVTSLNPLPSTAAAAARISHQTVETPFPSLRFQIDAYTFTFADVFAVGALAVAAVCVALFLRGTRGGRAVRGTADNPEAAGLLGINTRLVSTMVWGLAAMLSGLASISSLLLNGIDVAGRDGGVSALLPALAAAMVAGFESLPLAAFVALWLYVMEAGTRWAFPNVTFIEPCLAIIILGALLLRRRTLQGRQAGETGLWESIRALRPAPRALRQLPGVRRTRAAVLGSAAAAAVMFPFVATFPQLFAGGTVLVDVMVAVSLLIVTGWVGQLNLGQYALVAIGAVVAAGLTAHLGWSFWLALPLAIGAGAAAAVLLGLAALRVHGLWLAPVTLVLGAAMPVVLFGEHWFDWLLPTGSVERPGFPFVDLSDPRPFYFLLLGCAVLSVLLALAFRRSRLGRQVIALRDNEPAALASGIDPLRSRIVALALSGAVAGFAGALLSIFQESVAAGSFGVDLSLNIFVMLILGGLGGVSGAVLGAVVGGTLLHITPDFAPLITGVGALAILLALPGGISQAVFAARDSVLRLVALRRGIDVPTLRAEVEAAEGGRWRLAPPRRGAGLDSLPGDQRYARASFLWGRAP